MTVPTPSPATYETTPAWPGQQTQVDCHVSAVGAIRVIAGELDDHGMGLGVVAAAIMDGERDPAAVGQQAFDFFRHASMNEAQHRRARGSSGAGAGGETGTGAFFGSRFFFHGWAF